MTRAVRCWGDPWAQHSALITAPSLKCSPSWPEWKSTAQRKPTLDQFLSQNQLLKGEQSAFLLGKGIITQAAEGVRSHDFC